MDDATELLVKLLEQHGMRLHALLVKLTLRHDAAEELVQELFLRLNASRSFRRAPNPEAYLFRSAINLAFDWRKQRTRQTTVRLGAQAAWDVSPLDGMIRREELAHVLAAIEQLSKLQRELITLRYIEGWSYETLADRFETTSHHARTMVSRAMARLRAVVHGDNARKQPKETTDVGDR